MTKLKGRAESVTASGDVSARYSLVLASDAGERVPFEFSVTGTDVQLADGDPIELWFTQTAGGIRQVQLLRNLRTGRSIVDRVNYGAGRFTWSLVGAAIVLLVLIYFAVRTWLVLGVGQ